jgi:hypothetical protein
VGPAVHETLPIEFIQRGSTAKAPDRAPRHDRSQ